MSPFRALVSVLLAVPAVAAAPGPLQVNTRVLVERRSAAEDGTTRVRLVPVRRVVPGDRVTVVVEYRNAGREAISDLVLTNPVPSGLAYRGVAPGYPPPELSIDGRRFAPLYRAGAGGDAISVLDVAQLRWRVARPVAPGQTGRFAFQAVLR